MPTQSPPNPLPLWPQPIKKQYLVMARCPHDDIPMFLTSDQKQAMVFAELMTIDHVREIAASVFNMDGISELIAATIVEYVDGKPTSAIKKED